MARPPAWRHTLDEARRQALVAIDFYNRPGDRRSLADFIVHLHLAWQNLLHADRMRRKLEIYYRQRGGQRRFDKNPDGSKKTWDLAKCLKEEFSTSNPIRLNLEFFIGLRNQIEHRFQDAVLDATAAEAHACIINFEAELVRRFGQVETLGSDLKFPVFVHALSPTAFETERRLRQNLPNNVSTYMVEFRALVPTAAREDMRFAYRLVLMPVLGPKTEADRALTFINQKDLTEDELHAMVGKQGSVLIQEKYRDAAHSDSLLPKGAAFMIEERIPFIFSINDFTVVRKSMGVGPVKSGSLDLLPKSAGFCAIVPASKQILYNPRFIDKVVAAISTAESYKTVLGKEPMPKSLTKEL